MSNNAFTHRRKYVGAFFGGTEYSNEEYDEKLVFETIVPKLHEVSSVEESGHLIDRGKWLIGKINDTHKFLSLDSANHPSFHSLRLKRQEDYQSFLDSLAGLNQEIEKTIKAKNQESRRQEWNRQPENVQKKISRVGRNTTKFIFILLLSFVVILFPCGVFFSMVVGNEFGFIFAVFVAFPLAFYNAKIAVKNENEKDRLQ